MEYIPRTCNIGKGEIRRRQLVALIGLILIITTTAGLVSAETPKSSRFSVFIPAIVFSIGFIQSRRKFCLAFGLMGTFNFGSLGKVSRVADSANRRQDRKTAMSILIQALSLALTITLIIYLLPI